MVRVVRLGQPVRDGQLQLVRPQPSGLVPGREAQPRPEEQQDVGRLRDDLPAGDQVRRRERGRFSSSRKSPARVRSTST
jgi:hypothetical protein